MNSIENKEGFTVQGFFDRWEILESFVASDFKIIAARLLPTKSIP
jgi:hypothetical protein